MTAAPTPAGFAPVFAGWNVWSVWQKNDLDIEIGSIGLDADRRLRVWVEDTARIPRAARSCTIRSTRACFTSTVTKWRSFRAMRA